MNASIKVRQKHEPLEALINGAGRAFSCRGKYLGPLSLALRKGIQVELDLVIIVPASMKRVKVQPWMLAVLTGQRLLLGDQILMFELGGCDNAG
jgi:hypothetical protein